MDCDHKLDLPNDYALIQELPWKQKAPLFMPVCTSNIDYHNFGKSDFDRSQYDHRAWLSSYKHEKRPWAEHFSEDTQMVGHIIDNTPGKHSMMPLINEKVSSLKVQHHMMSIVQKAIKFLNSNLVSISYCSK